MPDSEPPLKISLSREKEKKNDPWNDAPPTHPLGKKKIFFLDKEEDLLLGERRILFLVKKKMFFLDKNLLHKQGEDLVLGQNENILPGQEEYLLLSQKEDCPLAKGKVFLGKKNSSWLRRKTSVGQNTRKTYFHCLQSPPSYHYY